MMERDAPAPPPPPPPPGQFNSPPGFGPPSNAQSCGFYQNGWWRPPPPVPFYYPHNGFHGAQNPFHNPATGWMQSSVSAPQPPNFISPGITPTIKTPEVKQEDGLTHPLQACQWQPGTGRSNDAVLLVDNAFSAVEGVGLTKLQKSMSSERIELERSAVSDDQENEKQEEKIHLHVSGNKSNSRSARRKRQKRLRWRTNRIAPQPPNFISPGITPTIKTPEVRQEGVTHPLQACQWRSGAGRSKDSLLVDNAFSAVEGVGLTKLQKSMSSKRIELERSAVSDDQENEKQEENIHRHVSEKKSNRRNKHERKQKRTYRIDSHKEGIRKGRHLCYPSTGEGDIMMHVESSMRNELEEAPISADSQEARQVEASNQSQPFPRKAKRKKDHVDPMEDTSSASEGGGEMRERKLQKLMSSDSEPNEVEVTDAIESLKEYKNIRDTQKENRGMMEVLKIEIGLLVNEKMESQNEVERLKCVLEAARLEVSKKKSAIDEIKFRCNAIPERLLDGLF